MTSAEYEAEALRISNHLGNDNRAQVYASLAVAAAIREATESNEKSLLPANDVLARIAVKMPPGEVKRVPCNVAMVTVANGCGRAVCACGWQGPVRCDGDEYTTGGSTGQDIIDHLRRETE